MTSLQGIPIVEAPVELPALNAPALLREIESLLAQLVEQGTGGAIDLQALPLNEADRTLLVETLGEGEVQATIQALGPSEVRETAINGVWWITHRNSDGHVTAELIEVTAIPEILSTHPADARAGLARLRTRLRGDND